ncbi:MAG: hypothetical protein LBU82_02935 [Treponema sp.]|jgi:thiosulfate/3-mercaptopyruvate sulfurtransferase|nr:hypothetical protein [Treponema sp.]
MEDNKIKRKGLITAAGLAAVLAVSVYAEGGQDSTANTGVSQTRGIRKGQDSGIILPPPSSGLVTRPEDQANFDRFVWQADKLKANYGKVVIIDARVKGDYNTEHLPGSVQLHWKDLIADKYNAVPSDSKIATEFARRGIDVSKTIVVYNEPLAGVAEEARILWLLRYLGITDSYILNGGLSYWKAHGGEVTKEKTVVPALNPVSSFKRNERLIISTEELASRLGTVNVLDSRSDEEYAKSRIPGVKFIWFKDFYHADGTCFTPAETRARCASLGFAEDSEVIVHCLGGIRSSLPFVLLQTAGYKDVRNYSASFAGWTGTKQRLDEQVYSNIPAYH